MAASRGSVSVRRWNGCKRRRRQKGRRSWDRSQAPIAQHPGPAVSALVDTEETVHGIDYAVGDRLVGGGSERRVAGCVSRRRAGLRIREVGLSVGQGLIGRVQRRLGG